jgi:hypothetical protein
VCLAVTTLVFHVPKFNRFIGAYVSSAYHVPPALPFIPPLTQGAGATLMVLNYVAGSGLLLGVAPRLCAWFLAASGFYVIALDPEYYAHNAQFHLTLLALVGCSSDRLSLWRLLRGQDVDATCPAWPERLVQVQLSVVFFYAALDKVFNPHWSVSGTVLATLGVRDHAPGLAWLQSLNQAGIRAFPGVMSVLITALEFFLAVAFLARSLWRVGLVLAFAFVAYLEFLLRPGVFAWDTVAALVVFLPSADRSWRVIHDPHRAGWRWSPTLLSRLDWLRRLRFVPADARHRVGDTTWLRLHLVSPHGRVYRGFDAVRMLPIVLPGPFFVVMAAARFGGGFLGSLGYGPWYDLPLLVLAVWLLLWVPGAARAVVRLVYPAAGRGLVRLGRRPRR